MIGKLVDESFEANKVELYTSRDGSRSLRGVGWSWGGGETWNVAPCVQTSSMKEVKVIEPKLRCLAWVGVI